MPTPSEKKGALKKIRLDQLLVERHFASDLPQAQKLVMAGAVFVNRVRAFKPSDVVSVDSALEVRRKSPWVSRGALKLSAAFVAFPISVAGKVCADAGSSTGGFTQVLLEKGAQRVYSIDSAHGELDWRLRNDVRVVVMEQSPVSGLDSLPELIDFVSVDISLVPFRKIAPQIIGWMSQAAEVVALIKPQYEARRDQLPEGAVITDPAAHREIVQGLLDELRDLKYHPAGLIASPILGKSGNREFLLWLKRRQDEDTGMFNADEELTKALESPVAKDS